MQRYPILFLNGTSSSGKTTTCEAFQKLWHEPTYYASCDKFIFMLPPHVLQSDAIRPDALLPIISAFHQSLPHIAACGLPVITDHVLESEQWLIECAQSLKEYDVLFVGVKCPLEELERREIARGDRQIGFARMQYERVHRYGDYDFEIDTDRNTPEECAAQLKELLLSGQKGTAKWFRKI